MRTYRWWGGLLVGLAMSAPAFAAAPPPTVPVSSGNGRDILVEGGVEKKGAWRRAETDHVVIFSNGSEAELARVASNLERLYHLMSRIYRPNATADGTAKLQITLFDYPEFYRKLGLRNIRSEEGPYPSAFIGQRYYDPRDDGEVLAVSRSDQRVELDTNMARNLYCDDMAEPGATECTPPYFNPITRSWEAVLYSGFAQHFILTYAPGAYPRWYLDGVGALFSTIVVKQDGTIDYAREPLEYKPTFRQVFRSYGTLNVADVLTGRYLDPKSVHMIWTPYHAWVLAHFFLYSNLKPARARQFQEYMAAVSTGTPMADAAKVFGDMRKLQTEISIYFENRTSFARTDKPQPLVSEPLISTLSESSAALVEAKVQLGSIIGTCATASDACTSQLSTVRDVAMRFPANPDAMVMAAEVECRLGHTDSCLADAERALKSAPDNVRALALKGMALTDRAIAGPAEDRAKALADARAPIEQAIQTDGEAPLPLIAYFESFTKAGQPVPEGPMIGMTRVIRVVPAAPGPRLYLGRELMHQGQADAARRVLMPVLLGGYDSPEKSAASALLQPGSMAAIH